MQNTMAKCVCKKIKNWKEHCIWSGIVDPDLLGAMIFKKKFQGSGGEMGMLVPTLFH